MKQYLLGIDIGTSACKIALFEKDGTVVISTTGEYPVYYPKEGWAEQNPEEWWVAICQAIQNLFKAYLVKAEEIVGIGIDGQSWSAIPIDKAGKVLANTPIWMDTRAQSICERLNKKIGADKIFELAGNSLQPTYTTAKIIWYRENMPEVYGKIDKILQSNAFIAYRLTGALSHDLSQGYGVHCFDMRKKIWNNEMCEALEIPRDFLPELVPSHKVVGRVTKKAAKESGLAEGTPVVAGGLDAACGTLGAGVIHPGETQEQGGQAGGMSICLEDYVADPRLIMGSHVVPGKWLLQGGTTGGGGVMRWVEKEFAQYERTQIEESGKSSLMQLNELANRVSVGSEGVIFLPYMAGERSPIWNPKAKGVYYGLDYSKTKGHMVRAAMEGVAYSLKHNLDIAQEAGAKVEKLWAMGGSANSLLWTQIKSDVTGKPISVPSSDTATTLGAAILAGVGIGMYQDFNEAVQMTVNVMRKHEPNQNHHIIYQKNYETYLKLYQSLKGLMNETNGEYEKGGNK
ncbi:MAG: xylulokinase [Lachnospiraceae bacterium]